MKFANNILRNMENKDFCVFILTHGRPDGVLTKKTLDKCGYTGMVYFVLDDEDKTVDRYVENYGVDNIIIFNKKEIADSIDEGNNFDNRKVIVHARNACFEIAKKIGVTYFLQLDDDYYEFNYKFLDSKGACMPKNIDIIFDLMIEFYKKINSKSIAFSQTGDFIGGIDNGKGVYRFSKRKCMKCLKVVLHKYRIMII